MKARSKERLGSDPCYPIQVDLSCMVDGELDPAAVKRVLVHVEVCAKCREFFKTLRKHVRAHRDVFHILEKGLRSERRAGRSRLSAGEKTLHIARIFYELGKAYVLISVSPSFKREVSREPVPIPEYRMKGKAILDRFLGDPSARSVRGKWIKARALLNGHLDSELENLEKGTNLLEESLEIQPRLHEARIYLGHARNLSGDLEGACEEFRVVLREARNLLMRGYALENLGNVYLQMGELEKAAMCFRRVVLSEIVAREPRFYTSWFNLGLAYALSGEFKESIKAFESLYEKYPGERSKVAEIMSLNKGLGELMKENPCFMSEMKTRFPGFFSKEVKP